jgi:NtrC-family two-component system sensor histidine kinase KinB
VVLSGLRTLEEMGTELTAEERQRIVHHGIMAGDRTVALLNSILDLAKLESGKMPLRVRDVPVRELVESALKEMGPWADQKQLKLEAQFGAGVEAVRADPELTLRILVNLLSNAIKFSPPESTIVVRVAAAWHSMLGFSVSDRGPGISKEWQDRVFDKFVQVEAFRQGGAVGSGLGLSFCRLAVVAQGGQIQLTSGQGKGTTFHFTLPTAGQGKGDRHSQRWTAWDHLPRRRPLALSDDRAYRHTRTGDDP